MRVHVVLLAFILQIIFPTMKKIILNKKLFFFFGKCMFNITTLRNVGFIYRLRVNVFFGAKSQLLGFKIFWWLLIAFVVFRSWKFGRHFFLQSWQNLDLFSRYYFEVYVTFRWHFWTLSQLFIIICKVFVVML